MKSRSTSTIQLSSGCWLTGAGRRPRLRSTVPASAAVKPAVTGSTRTNTAPLVRARSVSAASAASNAASDSATGP